MGSKKSEKCHFIWAQTQNYLNLTTDKVVFCPIAFDFTEIWSPWHEMYNFFSRIVEVRLGLGPSCPSIFNVNGPYIYKTN